MCVGPTTASRTLSAILVTMETWFWSSSSKTIEPTSPNGTDGAVMKDDGWLAGLTPVKLPLGAFTAYDLYAAPYAAQRFRSCRWGRGEACAKMAPLLANILERKTNLL